MKKHIIPLLAMALVVPCMADGIPALLIKTQVAEQSISLADISKVNYTATEMHIALRNGNTHTFVIDDIRSMKFGEISDSSSVTRIASPADAKLPVSLFRIDGMRTSGKSGSHAPVIIIKSGKDTRKVIK